MSTLIQPETNNVNGVLANTTPAIEIKKLNLYYGEKQALADIDMTIPANRVTAIIGPSGCGKSTLLRCINRMHDLVEDVSVDGSIRLGGLDILNDPLYLPRLRSRVGMVFQRPNPFPASIFDNVAYGLRLKGNKNRRDIKGRVESALKGAGLWEEVKNSLHESALGLSGGQQQRLVIARAIALNPRILLLDEPASALDPISTLRLEELISELKRDYTVVIVTHSMEQASRVSDFTAFMYMGSLIEFNATSTLFTNPKDSRTEDYICGRFG